MALAKAVMDEVACARTSALYDIMAQAKVPCEWGNIFSKTLKPKTEKDTEKLLGS